MELTADSTVHIFGCTSTIIALAPPAARRWRSDACATTLGPNWATRCANCCPTSSPRRRRSKTSSSASTRRPTVPSRCSRSQGAAPARLKLNGSFRSYSPLSRLVELEALLAGIDAKRSMWLAFASSAVSDAVADVDFEALATHATEQRRRLQPHRRDAAHVAFRAAAGATLTLVDERVVDSTHSEPLASSGPSGRCYMSMPTQPTASLMPRPQLAVGEVGQHVGGRRGCPAPARRGSRR